jgi:hypothetical protein
MQKDYNNIRPKKHEKLENNRKLAFDLQIWNAA